jgi:hypothetical protein
MLIVVAGCLAYSSIRMMEVVCSSETSANFYRIIQHHIPEDSNLYNHRCENLTSKTKASSTMTLFMALMSLCPGSTTMRCCPNQLLRNSSLKLTTSWTDSCLCCPSRGKADVSSHWVSQCFLTILTKH